MTGAGSPLDMPVRFNPRLSPECSRVPTKSKDKAPLIYRDAGVGTLGITPMAWDRDGRLEQLRLVAELAGA